MREVKRVLGIICTLLVVLVGTNAQELKVVKYEEVERLMSTQTSELKVFNFWATWCGPCIKELPYFESANNRPDVDVYLVSLDFPEDKDKVIRFMQKKNLQSDVILLNEKDYDSYMGKVDEDWSGAIPATLFVQSNGKKHFFEKPFTKEELDIQISYLAD